MDGHGIASRGQMRAPRSCGRGVRARGAGRMVVTPLVEEAPVRGEERGSRRVCRSSRGPIVKKRPTATEPFNIVNLNILPEETPLKHALSVKKKRSWRPSPPRVAIPSLSEPHDSLEGVEGINDIGQLFQGVQQEVVIPPIPSSREILEDTTTSLVTPVSPALVQFSERGEPNSSPSLSSQRPRLLHPRALHVEKKKKILEHFNYGSEPDTDESDDDEVAAAFLPRTLRVMLGTSEDQEDVAAESPPTLRVVAGPSSFVPCPSAILQPPPPSPTPNHHQLNPTRINDFEWKSFPDPPVSPESRREFFSQNNVGPTTPFVDPYDAFIAIWDQQLMEHITFETNRYAQQLVQQMFATNTLHPGSRICKWVETTTNELYTYFGIVLAMGMVVKSRIEEYWSSNVNIFYTPGFSAHMSLRRFQLLGKCLHFNNNEDMCVQKLDISEAKLFKIQPVLSHLNRKFQSMMNLRQNIALDESLLQWKNWLDINQFIPNKAAAVGIKTYEICESQTGYLWRFEVIAHKKVIHQSQQPSPDPLDASTPSIVLRLIQGLEHKGHTLWMDDYYNSPALARKLKTLGFDCVGTLRTNCQFVPEELKNLSKSSMRPGQITGFTSGDVDLMAWRDQNRVAAISTYHGNFTTTINGTKKPILIHDYNIMMGGVDKKDQVLAMYPIERKRTRVWYKKLFRRLLNISVLNSFIIVKHSTPMTHRVFRMSLIESLLQKNRQTNTPLTLLPNPSVVFEVKDHYLAEYPFSSQGTSRLRRKCCLCPKKVHYYCVGCAKSVCMSPCYVSLHK